MPSTSVVIQVLRLATYGAVKVRTAICAATTPPTALPARTASRKPKVSRVRRKVIGNPEKRSRTHSATASSSRLAMRYESPTQRRVPARMDDATSAATMRASANGHCRRGRRTKAPSATPAGGQTGESGENGVMTRIPSWCVAR